MGPQDTLEGVGVPALAALRTSPGDGHLHSAFPPTRMKTGNMRPHERPDESRAAEIGLVVSLLTRADDETLRKIRKSLEDKVG